MLFCEKATGGSVVYVMKLVTSYQMEITLEARICETFS